MDSSLIDLCIEMFFVLGTHVRKTGEMFVEWRDIAAGKLNTIMFLLYLSFTHFGYYFQDKPVQSSTDFFSPPSFAYNFSLSFFLFFPFSLYLFFSLFFSLSLSLSFSPCFSPFLVPMSRKSLWIKLLHRDRSIEISGKLCCECILTCSNLMHLLTLTSECQIWFLDFFTKRFCALCNNEPQVDVRFF